MRVISSLLVAAAILLSGCVSTVSSTKADSTKPGVRYYLPQVFIKVTPSTDGAVKVETEYLPDPRHEYTINTSSVLGNYTIDINRNERGFLEGVTFNSDSTAIAKQLLTSESNLKAARIDAQAAKDKTEGADAKAAADKQAAALAAADKAQKDADVAVQVAQAKLTLLQDLDGQPGAPANLKDQVLAARLAVSEAVVRRDAARAAYTTLSANVAAANGLDVKGAAKAPEPVFLKVEMQPDSVRLVQAFPQTSRDTWKIPTASTAVPELQFFPTDQVVRPAEKTGALTAVVQSTTPLLSYALQTVRDLKAPQNAVSFGPGKEPLTALLSDRTTLRIDLAKDTPAGDYALTYKVEIGSKDKPEPKTQIIRLRIER